MNRTYQKHLAAIASGEVTKTNVIGIRKALNANWRDGRGYSTSRTSPSISDQEAEALEIALREHAPAVTGELHESGLQVLRNPRNRKALASVLDLIEDSPVLFRLIGYTDLGRGHAYFSPYYLVETRRGTFRFRNIPWQASYLGIETGPRVWEVKRHGLQG